MNDLDKFKAYTNLNTHKLSYDRGLVILEHQDEVAIRYITRACQAHRGEKGSVVSYRIQILRRM